MQTGACVVLCSAILVMLCRLVRGQGDRLYYTPESLYISYCNSTVPQPAMNLLTFATIPLCDSFFRPFFRLHVRVMRKLSVNEITVFARKGKWRMCDWNVIKKICEIIILQNFVKYFFSPLRTVGTIYLKIFLLYVIWPMLLYYWKYWLISIILLGLLFALQKAVKLSINNVSFHNNHYYRYVRRYYIKFS